MTRIFDMHERCSNCGTKYKMEPSFFFGAMYVSYALGVAFAVAAFIITYFFFGGGLVTTFIAITATLVVFMPVIIRLSRNIWINFFLNYKKQQERRKG
jgi:Ca2+-dependent lipid-binding protein